MNKKYIARLSDEERQPCQNIVKKLKGTSQKVRRAQILLKADADGPAWTDARIAEAFNCRVQTDREGDVLTQPNGEGSEILTFIFDDVLPAHKSGTIEFDVTVK